MHTLNRTASAAAIYIVFAPPLMARNLLREGLVYHGRGGRPLHVVVRAVVPPVAARVAVVHRLH